MDKYWRTGSGPLIALLAVVLVAGCGGSEASSGEADGAGEAASGAEGGEGAGEPRSGGSLTWAINVENLNMDPAWCGSQGMDRCNPIFETLLRYDVEEEDFVPGLAESFESEDGVTWTLTLREGVTFSDGTDFDAEAVAFNWDRIKDPQTASPAQSMAQPLTWEVVDPLTLEVTSEEPNFQLPWALVQGMGMIGSPTAIEEKGEDFGNEPVGAGPFVLERWTRNSEAVYARNPDYYQEGLPYLDEFVLKVIPQDDQRMNALRTGEIDVNWSLLIKDAEAMEAEGFTIHRLPLVGGTGLMFNHDDPVASDPDLIQAMLHAYDSAQINNAVYGGAPAVDAFLFPESPYRDDSYGVFPEKDLEEAQRLFDAYRDRTGEDSVTVEFLSYAGVPALEQVAEVIQAQMNEIEGLTFEINAVEGATLSSNQASGNFQTMMGATLSQHMDALYEVFHSEGARNFGHYSNPTVDEALETSRRSNDEAEVTEAYKVLNGELSKDGPIRNWRYTFAHLHTDDKVNGLILMGTSAGLGAYLEEAWIDE